MPTAAVVEDISGLGRCSLVAAVSVLAAMGVQPCPVPTAVLTNQTGYASYDLLDCAPLMRSFAPQWKAHGVTLDGIYTGFCSSPGQLEAAGELIDAFHSPGKVLLLVDPVMGDDGRRYPGFDQALCAAVARLARRAEALTPNVTEACLLTGQPYAVFAHGGEAGQEAQLRRMSALLLERARLVVVTGWRCGGEIRTVLAQKNRFMVFASQAVEGSYSGTGDLLASAFLGGLLRGDVPEQSLRRALRFLESALQDAHRLGAPPQDGVPYENWLHLLRE